MQSLKTGSEKAGDPVRDAAWNAVLQRWEGIAVPEGFEDAVWRRIRTSATTCRPGFWERAAAWWQPHPVLAGVAAAAVALLVGMLAALSVPGHRAAEHHALLRPGTLAGSYLAMSAGGAP